MASPRTRVGTDSDRTAPMTVNAAAMVPPIPRQRRYRETAFRNAPTRAMNSAKRRFPATMYRSRFPVRSVRWPMGRRKGAWGAAARGGGGRAGAPSQDPRGDDGRRDEKRRPEAAGRDHAAQSRSGRHPEIEGGGVPAIGSSEKQGRRYVADVRHHGRGEAGQTDSGEEVDRADLQGSPGQEQKERGEPGDRHAGEDETPAAQSVGDQAQRQGEERRGDHETGVDHPRLYRGRPAGAGGHG